MRHCLLLILALPLAAQTWDLRLEAPFPKGQNLPRTLIAGTGQLLSGDLDTGQGGILSVNHRLIRFGPVLRLEWAAEITHWNADGNIQFIQSSVQQVERKERQSFFKREQSTHYQKLAGSGDPPPSYQVDPVWMQLGITGINSTNQNSSLVQSGAGLGLNAQFWIPFTGICAEMGVIQRFQRYKFSSAGSESDGTIGRTWLRVGMRYRLPFIPLIHPYIAASYQQPINNDQPVDIDSVQDILDYYRVQGKGQEFNRMWTFGVGITF